MPQKKIGALWLKEQRGGGMRMTGEVELPDGTKLPIIVFKNSYKTDVNRQPDQIIYLREDRPQAQQPSDQAQGMDHTEVF